MNPSEQIIQAVLDWSGTLDLTKEVTLDPDEQDKKWKVLVELVEKVDEEHYYCKHNMLVLTHLIATEVLKKLKDPNGESVDEYLNILRWFMFLLFDKGEEQRSALKLYEHRYSGSIISMEKTLLTMLDFLVEKEDESKTYT